MKKLLFAISILMLSINSFALVGISVHGGIDMISIDEFNGEIANIKIGDKEYSLGNLMREEIKNPVAFGAQLYFDLPIVPIGIETGFSASYAKYKWTASNSLTGPDGPIDLDLPGINSSNGTYSEEFTFLRMSADATLKWYFLNLPPVINVASFYIGGGAGMHFITPIVSEELFREELKNQNVTSGLKVDAEELAKSQTVFGGHFVAGVRIKPPVIPIAINVDYKHTFTAENDYGDNTNKFGTLKAGLSLYF